MKVLIVNTSEHTGGAAVAASRLCEALINNGVKAKMLVCHKESDSLYVVPSGSWFQKRFCFLWERIVIWLNDLLDRTNLFKVSIANVGQDITSLPEFREADVIHLHWVNQGFLSCRSIEKILKSGKPVVWTMHDMWEATGICHHAYECDRYTEVCGHCPFLKLSFGHDLSYHTFRRKQKMLSAARQLHFVAVSEWLSNRCRQSALIGRFPITVIPNGISLSSFTYTERDDARTTLGIEEPYVMVFGAARIDEPIKGFGYLIDALQMLVDEGRFRSDEVRLLLFGTIRDPQLLHQIPLRYTHLGYLKDVDQLSLIYSAANIVVSSSLYETFGQTLIEAQACGCIPVSFDGSGQTDIITHQQNGFLAERLSVASLAEGIEWGLHADIPAQQLRRHVARHYAESVVANQYIKLYESILHITL